MAEYSDRVRIEYLRVPMRDGVELCAKITRPDSDGPFPAVMEYNPYRRIGTALPDFRSEYPPVVPYLAEHGYVIVQFDVRGTGNSGGSTTDIYSDEERQDALEMVTWIADQRWCEGSVGMIGKSYGAVVQWQVAVQNPPALKAVIVRSANDDVYTEWVYPGGCLRPYMLDTYSPLMNVYNFAPPDPEIVGERWHALWQERLEKSGPWGASYVSQSLQGDYWQSRSLSLDYQRVKCAAFVVAGWSDCYPTALLRAFEKLNCPKKALVGPWGHWYGEEPVAVPGPRIDTRPLYRRWFDQWLKGLDTGIMEEPPVTFFVRRYSPPKVRMPLEEPGAWRSENEWPIGRTVERTFFLGTAELTDSPATETDDDEFAYHPGAGVSSGIHWGGGILPCGMPLDQRLDDAFSLVYTTAPLDAELEITGTPMAVLFVSSTAEVAYFRVKLIDVAPDGTAKLVRYGGLNATHRSSHFEPQPLVPGQVYELQIPLKTVSYVFEPGHRLRLAVSGADFQNAWPTGQSGVHTIHRGGRYVSRIIVPAVSQQSPELAKPILPELPPADPQGLRRPTEYSITQDLAARTTSVRLHQDSESRGDLLSLRSEFLVSQDSPAEAELTAQAHYRISRPQYEMEIRADETTTSDADVFRHTVKVTAIRDGQECFKKKWSVSAPRRLN